MSNIFFALIMGCFMSFSISAITTLDTIGISEMFISLWMRHWLITFPAATLCILIFKPIAIKATMALMKSLPHDKV